MEKAMEFEDNKTNNKKEGLTFKGVLKEYFSCKKNVVILFFVFLVAIIAIIRADFYYVDDMGRTAEGYKGWGDFSRYLSNLLSIILHNNYYLTDISPLPQILAVLIMAFSGATLIYVFTGRAKVYFWDLVAVIPICISPYFLQCLSYKFDAPYMALSVFFSIFPLLFKNKGLVIYALVTTICTLLMCLSYQSSSGIYPCLVILLAFNDWNNKKHSVKDIVKWCSISASSYMFAMLIFKFLVLDLNNSKRYLSTDSLPLEKLIPGIGNNILQYLKILISDFSSVWIVPLAALIVYFIFKSVRSSKQNKYIATIVTMCVLLITVIISFGAFIILEELSLLPRSMYGVFVLFSAVALCCCEKNKCNVANVAALALAFSYIIFSFSYGNALSIQAKYTDYRISMVAESISELEDINQNETYYVQLKGSIGYAQPIKNMPSDFNLLRKMVPITFRENYYWGTYGLINYYGLENLKADTSTDFSKFDLTVQVENELYSVLTYKNYILVELK